MTSDPGIKELVERQMRNWELVQTHTSSDEPETHKQVEDFVCISRDVGAGASRIGVMLGERLDWPVFDKEILHVMAGDEAIREQINGSMDDGDRSWCEAALRSLPQPEFAKNGYFHKLSGTILSLARQGSAVFIGRGADLILPRNTGLRVRIVAPLAMRIKRIAERSNLSPDDARKKVKRLDEERADFIRDHFHVNVHDAERYDLVVNLERVSRIQAVDLIESARDILAIDQLAGR